MKASRLVIAACLLAPVVACSPTPAWYARSVRSFLEARQDKVIVQRWDLSCGAAALATILTYQHGHPVTERQVALGMLRKTTPELVRQRLGFSLLDMKRYVQERGFDADGYSNLTIKDLQQLAPIIVPIYVRGNSHFVIFRGMQGDRILLADPAFGGRTIPIDQFGLAWQSRIGFTVSRRDGLPMPNQLAAHPSDFWASSTTARSQAVVMAALRREDLYEEQQKQQTAVAQAKPSPNETSSTVVTDASPPPPVKPPVTPVPVAQAPPAVAGEGTAAAQLIRPDPGSTQAATDRPQPAAKPGDAAAAADGDLARRSASARLATREMAGVAAGQASRPVMPPIVGMASSPSQPPSAASRASRADAVEIVALPPPTTAQPAAVQRKLDAAETTTAGENAATDRRARERDSRAAARTPSPAAQVAPVSVLLRRGEDLLFLGDVAAARLFFKRAAMLGSAQASKQVAKTYDPQFLFRIGAVGIRSDVAQAREWYKQAAARGDAEAAAKLTALNSVAAAATASPPDVR